MWVIENAVDPSAMRYPLFFTDSLDDLRKRNPSTPARKRAFSQG
jgi:hypothetical protein